MSYEDIAQIVMPGKETELKTKLLAWRHYLYKNQVGYRQARKKEQNRTHGNPAAVYNCDKLDSVGNLGDMNPNALQAGSVGAYLHFVEGMDVLFFFLFKNFDNRNWQINYELKVKNNLLQLWLEEVSLKLE